MSALSPIAPMPKLDAVKHAAVVLLWNVAVTAGMAAAFALLSGLGEIRWTREYGLALAAKVGADVVAALVGYFGRLLLPLRTKYGQ